MQGNLNEIDIRSILQLIELGQRTGELFVEAYCHSQAENACIQSWFVFFFNGQIVYATDSDSNLSRLRDYLRSYRLDASLDCIAPPAAAADNAPEYSYLWALLEQQIITPANGRSIIQSIVHETLFDLLSLHQGAFIFEHAPPLSPQLTTFRIGSKVRKIMSQVQEWKQLNPHIQSPYQCLAIANSTQLRQFLPLATVNHLECWADGKTSLRQIARYLNQDILTVGKAIYPFVKQGWLQMHDPVVFATPNDTSNLQLLSTAKPRIVCIDDAIAICETIESILKLHSYEAIGCSSPLQAFNLVFQLKPDLILCDIAMPELDGYELCAMLRRSSSFRQTPIIMLTGKDQFIDRVRARMVGATDYLTKPFTSHELLMLVEKHLHHNSINFAKPQFVAI